MFIQRQDGCIVDETGKVLYFTTEQFLEQICQGDCCFICGASPDKAQFNDEHILPQWILRRFDLWQEEIGLPNNTGIRYDQYVIPCCTACNAEMGQRFESPIQDLMTRGYEAVDAFNKQEGPWLLFLWMSLIFLKTHLKDTLLRLHRDRRLGNASIGDAYEWEKLHHLHCLVRSFHTGANLSPRVLGSMLFFPMEETPDWPAFDYKDIYEAKTMLLRVGTVAIIAVLDDSCAAYNFFTQAHRSFKVPITPLGARELLCHFAFLNTHLEDRPEFTSRFSPKDGTYTIDAELPAPMKVKDFTPSDFGTLLYALCEDLFPADLDETTRNHIRAGRWSFLRKE